MLTQGVLCAGVRVDWLFLCLSQSWSSWTQFRVLDMFRFCWLILTNSIPNARVQRCVVLHSSSHIPATRGSQEQHIPFAPDLDQRACTTTTPNKEMANLGGFPLDFHQLRDAFLQLCRPHLGCLRDPFCLGMSETPTAPPVTARLTRSKFAGAPPH